MQALYRKVKDGSEFNRVFDKPEGKDVTIRRDANVGHTVNFIPKVVRKTLPQTKKIARELKGKSVYETCKNIWHFVYDHIAYQKDAHGLEQVRSPRRTWADRHTGVDCDCYTTFISSILTNLGITHAYRITKYREDRFQHIYPVVPLKTGEYITIDCVVEGFDYEEPYSEKKDFKMDLQYLDGIEDELTFAEGTEWQGWDGVGDLGLFKRLRAKAKSKAVAAASKVSNTLPASTKKPGLFKKIGNTVKKVAHVVNRVNPATVLLRNGVLAAMKLNYLGIAEKIKWAYLRESDAVKKGIPAEKHKKLKNVLNKIENIFYGAGGKPVNFKSAIMKGKGNSGKNAMNGISFAGLGSTPVSEVLGRDLWYAENVEGMEGFAGLGEPVTASAAIGAASAVLAPLAVLLKSIGSLFPKKEKEAEVLDESEATEVTPEEVLANESYQGDSSSSVPGSYAPASDSGDSPAGSDPSSSSDQGFWDKNKKWLKPTLIGVGGLTVLAIGYKVVNSKKKASRSRGLSGISRKRRVKRKTRTKVRRKKIALL